ncbi:hypothetical protein TRFO_04954 [Tritrichomonas foetus]|uniref:Uncharacterized protein n=1 Tax=Tritrichomonas foetus TaxID=1144522 RepID=A0A1J4KBI3_9EUKA|nr:hypothetical protein TRFO_04954 [Tritrichomonas foetus]|eukprot:OHT08330.1 hypothetical protein TRFO_04954 [Tritrichomonas foetus]
MDTWRAKLIDVLLEDDLYAFMQLTDGNNLFEKIVFPKVDLYKYPKELQKNQTYLSLITYFGAERIYFYLNDIYQIETFLKNPDFDWYVIYIILRNACIGGNLNIIRDLYNNQANFSKVKHISPPIYAAFKYGNLDVIRYLYMKGVEIKPHYILSAIEHGHLNIVQFYMHDLQINNKPNIIDYVKTAIYEDQVEIVSYIFKHTPEQIIQKFKRSKKNSSQELIEVSVFSGSLAMVKFMISTCVKLYGCLSKVLFEGLLSSLKTEFSDMISYFLTFHDLANSPDQLFQAFKTSIEFDNFNPLRIILGKYHQKIIQEFPLSKILTEITLKTYETAKFLICEIYNEDIYEHTYELLLNAINANTYSLISKMQKNGFDFSFLKDEHLDNCDFHSLVLLLDSGAKFKFSKYNMPVRRVLNKGKIADLICLSKYNILNNEVIESSGCLTKERILKKTNFISILMSYKDLDLSKYPHFLDYYLKNQNYFLSFFERALERNVCFTQEHLNILLNCPDQNWALQRIAILFCKNIEFPIQKIYQMLSLLQIQEIIKINPSLVGKFYQLELETAGRNDFLDVLGKSNVKTVNMNLIHRNEDHIIPTFPNLHFEANYNPP